MNPDDKNQGATGVKEQKALNSQPVAIKSEFEIEQQSSAEELSKSSSSDKLTMHVKVHSPFRDYFDGLAISLSGENLTGPFDILPKHHNFISLLIPCVLSIRSADNNNDEPMRIRISGGI